MRRSFAFLALVVAPLLSGAIPLTASAASVSELRSQIDEHSDKIAELEQEIAGYQKQLNALGAEKQTLQSAIKSLDVSRSQMSSRISVTENKISSANLKLEELSFAIADKEELIELDRSAVAESLRNVARVQDTSVVEQLFSTTDLATAWEAVDALVSVSNALKVHAEELAEAKVDLTNQHTQVTKTKQELTALRTDLANQKKALDVNRAEKDKLLKETQNQESAYQALIAKKRAEQAQFEAALQQLEDSLQTAIDPSRIPSPGSGVLAWPFSRAYMESCKSKEGVLKNVFCITQYFGNTSFSTANPQIYNGAGHNGVDFSAPTGTPIQAALGGTVKATGNTDLVPGCYSFGRYVVIDHANGLSTLYAHLSSTQVSKGSEVSTGQVIGYSGMTGYATGPHLHLAVYASQGLQIMDLGAWRSQTGGVSTSACARGGAVIPVAPQSAYLNPMSYF